MDINHPSLINSLEACYHDLYQCRVGSLKGVYENAEMVAPQVFAHRLVYFPVFERDSLKIDKKVFHNIWRRIKWNMKRRKAAAA